MVWNQELVREGLAGPLRLVAPEIHLDLLVQLRPPVRLRLFRPELRLGQMVRPVRADPSHPPVQQDRPDLADRQFLEDLAVRRLLGLLEHPADQPGPERLALVALRKQ